MPQTAL